MCPIAMAVWSGVAIEAYAIYASDRHRHQQSFLEFFNLCRARAPKIERRRLSSVVALEMD
jgi:hypothetical protein